MANFLPKAIIHNPISLCLISCIILKVQAYSHIKLLCEFINNINKFDLLHSKSFYNTSNFFLSIKNYDISSLFMILLSDDTLIKKTFLIRRIQLGFFYSVITIFTSSIYITETMGNMRYVRLLCVMDIKTKRNK